MNSKDILNLASSKGWLHVLLELDADLVEDPGCGEALMDARDAVVSFLDYLPGSMDHLASSDESYDALSEEYVSARGCLFDDVDDEDETFISTRDQLEFEF